MDKIGYIKSYEQLKILSDSRRLSILRLLMASSATLSQLGQALGEHPARVRHHLKQLERLGLIELTETHMVRGFVEKYYRATARAFIFNEIILPQNPDHDKEIIVLLGSHDIALGLLTERLQGYKGSAEILALAVGSLEGLVALRQGTAQITGCHLLDIESGEYNLPYVRHFFPDRPVVLVTLAHREQGLLVQPGNPHRIRGLEDLTRPDLILINRNPGSGTRLWLDKQLSRLGISYQQVRSYIQETRTHTGVAQAILQRKADVGLGIRAAASQYGLDFIPLFQERYDLVIPGEQVESQRLQPLLNHLQSAEFRRVMDGLGGYDTAHTGDRLMP
jgi:molybdate-binding protein/DNA-binding MarR family transcriptional regulator